MNHKESNPFYLIILVMMLMFFASSKVPMHSQTPQAVKSNFQKMYPNENDPDWHLDSNGNYESNFKVDGISYRADFSPSGTWIETESSIDKSQLPTAILRVIKMSYSDYEISEVEKVEHYSKGLFYDVEFKQKGKNKDVEFKASGEIIN